MFTKHAVLISLLFLFGVSAIPSDDQLKAWGNKLGDELQFLSLTVTKTSEIQKKYTNKNARVDTNNGESLLNQIVDNLDKMIKKKVESVQCLSKAAESYSDEFEFVPSTACNFTYDSLKLGTVTTLDCESENYTYDALDLHTDRHFYNTEVNTKFSGIHVPTNVYDRYLKVAEDIQWSKEMDEAFVKNYQSDPSLMFQYFGSISGILRLYPAMKWKQPEFDQVEVDLYDCRTRPWFIQSATCAKDVIILMDNSGSMTGMRNTIAKLVVQKLLETLSINDLINVFQFSWLPEPVLPCFNDTLVPGTRENIDLLKEAVSGISPEGNASFPNAFSYALNLLARYREINGCNDSLDCNQAIMLVTDSLPGNITEVFDRLNNYNDTKPVRVFTYLLGIEVRGVQEIQDIACNNRGYYVHVHALDEVSDQVLKYIPVIARPLVLQNEVHPVTWTHAFADVRDPKLATWLWDVMSNEEQQFRLKNHLELKDSVNFMQSREDEIYVQSIEQYMEDDEKIHFEEYHLMTSVSVPVFDKKRNRNNETKTAEILGVTGIDVPLSEFQSLTYPYKIGANGYAFVVTNIGYMLVHPDLRPVYKGVLKDNFHSVDLVEVEFGDEDIDIREYDEKMVELRNAMIRGEQGKLLGVNVKFHADDFKRILTESRDYYYKPLPNTPFTVGLAIPSEYGNYQIGVNDEYRQSRQQAIPLVNYFHDSDWSIHPEWTYCKYYYPVHHYFETPEDELTHFLDKMSNEFKFDWKGQYDEEFSKNDVNSYDECDRPEVDHDEYYCDKDLIQLLIFDARVTHPVFKNTKIGKSSHEEEIIKRFNPTLRFMATQSGFTRWQQIPHTGEKSNFGRIYNKAIEETWYRSAVLQKRIDVSSFVFSVPFDSGNEDDLQIRATQALFPKDGGRDAPASVVGFEFSHESFVRRFYEITNNHSAEACISDTVSCYILDHNGYMLFSENDNDTGRFFGKVQKGVMEQMIMDGIFRQILVYDYQGLCMKPEKISSDGNILLSPVRFIHQTVQWILGQVLWTSLRNFLQQVYWLDPIYSSPVDTDYDEDKEDYINQDGISDYESQQKGEKWDMTKYVGPSVYRKIWPCDKKHYLHLLNQHNITDAIYYKNRNAEGYLPYYAVKIRHTNLIIVVVISDVDVEEGEMVTEEEMAVGSIEQCHRFSINDLPKKRLSGCFTYHPLEDEIDACGHGETLKYTLILIFISFLVNFTL